MQQTKPIIYDQRGFTLIIVMMVLLSLTALGLTAVNISTSEINLAGNDKWQKTGFYNADPGLHGTPSVIYPNLNPETTAPLQPADTSDPDNELCLEYINGQDPASFKDLVYAAKADPEANQYASKDISFRACGIRSDIDVTPRGSQPMSGGGVEFASRAEGLGASGSEAKFYMITSTGDGASNNSTYSVFGHYRWTEAAGGLK